MQVDDAGHVLGTLPDSEGISEMNATSNDSMYEYIDFDNPLAQTSAKALLITCYSIVFVMCIVGNSMVLFAIARSPRLRSKTNYFLGNLAIADFFVGSFCVLPNLSTFLGPTWILGTAMCKIYYYIWNVSYTASIIIQAVISIERYFAITYPLRARHFMTHKKLVLIQLIIWMIAILYNIPYLFLYDTYTFVDAVYCYSDYRYIDSLKALSLVNIIVWYVLPLALIACMYYRIGLILWKAPMVPALRLQQFPEDDCSSKTTISRITHQQGHTTNSQHSNSCLSRDRTDLSKSNTSSRGSDESSQSDKTNNIASECSFSIVFGVNSCQIRQHPSVRGHMNSIEECPACEARTCKTCDDEENKLVRAESKISKRANYKRSLLSSSNRVLDSRRRVVRLLVMLVVTFSLCVFPHMMKVLNHYWYFIVLPQKVEVILSPVLFLILYLNSVLNPILYALFSTNFRRGFKESLWCFR